MRVAYHPGYFLELPPRHPFPMAKYPLLYRRVLDEGLVDPHQVLEPAEASLEDLGRVHTVEYLDALAADTLGPVERRRIGVPWSQALWRRSRLAVQGTLEGARMALEEGLAGNLAGGTHHAFAGHGEGFCVLNDVAIAIRALQHAGRIQSALVVDLDVHQGNGTAALFADDPRVYTFSMHGERNYPLHKQRSSLDVGLADGVGDEEYLQLLETHLATALAASAPELVFYLAGVDVAAGDRYGRLCLSDEGLARRERLVLRTLRAARLPVVVTIAGGYATSAERTADLHAIVFREAAMLSRP